MNRNIVIAVVIALTGIAVGVWALLPRSPANVRSASAPSKNAASASAPLPASFPEYEATDEDNAREAALAKALESLRRSFNDLPSTQRLPAAQEEAFVQEVAAIWRIYLSADYDGYVDYMRSRGGSLSVDPPDHKPDQPGMREFWLSTVEGVAHRPINPNGVFVLPKYLDGRAIENDVLPTRGVNAAQREGAFHLPMDAQTAALTVYEALLPLDYQWGEHRGRILLGVALAWDAEKNRWLLWSMTTYNTHAEAKFVLGPVF